MLLVRRHWTNKKAERVREEQERREEERESGALFLNKHKKKKPLSSTIGSTTSKANQALVLAQTTGLLSGSLNHNLSEIQTNAIDKNSEKDAHSDKEVNIGGEHQDCAESIKAPFGLLPHYDPQRNRY